MITNFSHWLQPQVTKKQVDNFREGKLTPCCQLLAEVVRRRKFNEIPALRYPVSLKGAKYPNDVFMISLPAGGILFVNVHAAQDMLCLGDISETSPQDRSPTFGDLAAAGTLYEQNYAESDNY